VTAKLCAREFKETGDSESYFSDITKAQEVANYLSKVYQDRLTNPDFD